MKTCSSYIHEFDYIDNMTEFLAEATSELSQLSNHYEAKQREFELAMIFESANSENNVAIMEAENDSVFGKIGLVVTNLLKKIAEFIRDITEAFTGGHKEVKDEMEIVSEMMKDHPEIAAEIANGINKDWFTYKDVASFEKDIAGLVSMLKKNEIDHKTFVQRVSDKAASFTKTGYPIIRGVVTAGGLVSIPTILVKKCTEASKSMGAIQELIKTTQEIYRNNREVHDAGAAASAINALARVANLVTQECKDRNETQSRFCQLLAKVTRGKIDIKRSPEAQLKYRTKKIKKMAMREARLKREETNKVVGKE